MPETGSSLNSPSFCICLLRVGIFGICHHIWQYDRFSNIFIKQIKYCSTNRVLQYKVILERKQLAVDARIYEKPDVF